MCLIEKLKTGKSGNVNEKKGCESVQKINIKNRYKRIATEDLNILPIVRVEAGLISYSKVSKIYNEQ